MPNSGFKARYANTHCDGLDLYLSERLDSFERSDELEGYVTLLIPSNVFQQEGVLENIFVGEVVLDLIDNLLDQIL